MPTNLLSLIFLCTALFSYEIDLQKTKNVQKPDTDKNSAHTLVRDDKKELVIDKNTGLMWQDNLDSKTIKKSRKDAKQYCRRLVLGGYDDWYLPRYKELKTIVDKHKQNPAIKDGFKNVALFHYWSSSPNMSLNIKRAFNIDFRNGQKYSNNQKGKCNVRCVRGKYKH